MLSVILLSRLMLITLSVIRYLICDNNLNWLLNLNLIYNALWTGLRGGLLISMRGKLSWFRLTSLITVVLLIWKWMGLFLRKNHLVWAGVPSWYFELLDKLQKQMFRTVGPSFAASLEPMADLWNVARLSVF